MSRDNEEDATEDEDVLQFPINDIADELIRSFIRRFGETDEYDDKITNGQYKFHSHDHHLSLVSPSSSHDDDEENSDDDDDDYFTYGEKSQVACDGCTAPIHPHKSKYYSCVEGKYFLHSTCFRLPQTFTPLHPNHTTPLKLQTRPKLDNIKCNILHKRTILLLRRMQLQSRRKMRFSPARDQTPGPLAAPTSPQAGREQGLYTDTLHIRCIGCSDFLVRPGAMFYSCQSCEFILCCTCVLLPASDDTCYLDQHVLPLAFNAAADHPGKFYCDGCELEMNPKCWMYHCRHCDTSYHPSCIHTVSGYDRNFKYGQEFNIETLQGHPLRVQHLIRKFRCHVCGRKEKNDAGFLNVHPAISLHVDATYCPVMTLFLSFDKTSLSDVLSL